MRAGCNQGDVPEERAVAFQAIALGECLAEKDHDSDLDSILPQERIDARWFYAPGALKLGLGANGSMDSARG